ncbi:MAG TPA: hypothetical protein VGG38_19075 [Acidimicrobiales bacterium]|jgi:hypothetical protein
MAFRVLAAVIGASIVVATGWSVLGTLVVPRRIRSNIPRVVFIVNRSMFHLLVDRTKSYEHRDRILAVQAPIQLIGQVVAWLALYELGFGLLMWPLVGKDGLGGALEQAGSALCTLGYLAPRASGVAALDSVAGLTGLGTVALQIGYLPTLYAAFNRREALITMLDSRAGVPSWGPELLARTHYGLGTGISAVSELPQLFEAWEQWSADVSESHTTYVPLVLFRSPRLLSSWVTAQLAVLDAAALYLALLPNGTGLIQARLCLRGGFTCLGNVARALRMPIPEDADPGDGISLSYEEFVLAIERMREVDFPVQRPLEEAWADFVGWRVNYEAAAYALAWYSDAPPALWSGPRRHEVEAIAPLRPRTAGTSQSASVENHHGSP